MKNIPDQIVVAKEAICGYPWALYANRKGDLWWMGLRFKTIRQAFDAAKKIRDILKPYGKVDIRHPHIWSDALEPRD